MIKNVFLCFYILVFSFSFSQEIKPFKYYVYYFNSDEAAIFEKDKNSNLSYYVGNRNDLKNFFDKYEIVSFYQALPEYPVENILRVYVLETYNNEFVMDYIDSFPLLVEKYEDISNENINLEYYPNDYGVTNPNGNQGSSIDRRDLDYINTPKAWDITTGSGIKLGISDGRIKPDDYDFVNKITFLPEYTYGSMSYDPNNGVTSHGTSVVALAAAQGNNDYGSVGVCYDCEILAVTYGNYNYLMSLANAGARVINMSWTGSSFSQVQQDAINYLSNDMGVVLVASAGNKPSHQTQTDFFCPPYSYFSSSQNQLVPSYTGIQISYPASYENVISVSSVEHYYLDASDSGAYCCTSPTHSIGGHIQNSFAPAINIDDLNNPIGLVYNGYPRYCQYNGNNYLTSPNGIVDTYTYNESVDILAPANKVYNHAKFAEEGVVDYHQYGGTSSSAPYVSGTAALMIGVYDCITPQEVENILKLTAKDVVNMTINQEYKNYIGTGKLETGDAVEFVNEMKKSNGDAYVKDHIFNRFTFNLEKINNNLTIENVTFKDDCVVDFTARNEIQLLPNTHLLPNINGHTHLSINQDIDITCQSFQKSIFKKEIREKKKEELLVYPNPVSSGMILNIISSNNSEKKIQIFDLLGKQVLNANIVNELKMNIPQGIYIIKIVEAGLIITKKLVVK
ncbi:S8 family serine peptidase [Flavobacterium sp. U410]